MSNVVSANEEAYRYTLTQREKTEIALFRILLPSLDEALEVRYMVPLQEQSVVTCGACATESGLFFLIICRDALAAIMYESSSHEFGYYALSPGSDSRLLLAEAQGKDFTGTLSMAELSEGCIIIHLNGCRACFSILLSENAQVRRLHDIPYPVDRSLLVPGLERSVWMVAGTIVSPSPDSEESEGSGELDTRRATRYPGIAEGLAEGVSSPEEAGPIHSPLTYSSLTERWIAAPSSAYQPPREACCLRLLSRYLLVFDFLDDGMWICDVDSNSWSRVDVRGVPHDCFRFCRTEGWSGGASKQTNTPMCGCVAALRLEKELARSEILIFKYWGVCCDAPTPPSETLLEIELSSLHSKIATSALARSMERLLTVGQGSQTHGRPGESSTSSSDFVATYNRKKALMQQREAMHRSIVRLESRLHSLSTEIQEGVKQDILMTMEAENIAADLKHIGYWLRFSGLDSGRQKPLKSAAGKAIPPYATPSRYSAGENVLMGLITRRQGLEKHIIQLKQERDGIREELIDLRRSMGEVDRELHPEDHEHRKEKRMPEETHQPAMEALEHSDSGLDVQTSVLIGGQGQKIPSQAEGKEECGGNPNSPHHLSGAGDLLRRQQLMPGKVDPSTSPDIPQIS